MRQQVQVEPALLATMVKTLDSRSKMEEIFLNRCAFASKNDTNGGKVPSGNAVFSDESVAGTFNGRTDSVVDMQLSKEKNLLKGQSDKYIFKSLFNYILKYIYQNQRALRGDFAAAVYDRKADRLVLARDPLGTRPLYYAEQPDYIAFASEMKFLMALPGFIPEMDETWIADAISTVQSEKWRTPYKHIRRVPAGHLLVFDQTLRQERYWDLHFDKEAAGMDYEQAVETFRRKLFKSVENRIKDDEFIATELSGGLDSSGVTTIANQLATNAGHSLYALTHAFSDNSRGQFFPYSDEREFSREVCRFIGLEKQIMCDADGYGLLDMLKKNIFIQSGPTQQGYSMFSDTLYDRGREKGVTKLLSGFGGDEGVTSKAGGFFEELAKQGRWNLFRIEFMQRGRTTDKISGASKIKYEASYMLWRYFPIAKNFARDLKNRTDWRRQKYPGLGFSADFEARMGIEKRFYARLGFPDDPNVRDRQYKRIMHDHVSQRFEYSYLDAKAYGIEYAYPLWDIDLLEFYYSLPAEFKFRNGMGRAIYRDAMKGLLPDKIRLRNDKTGATVPTVQQRFVKDYDAVTDLIRRSRANNSYHYLDYDRMLAWQERMLNRGFKDKVPANPSAFFNSLQILLLQEMERTGEFKSGIRT